MPFLCRHSEKGHIQHIGFIGIDKRDLFPCEGFGNQIMFYRVGVYPVIYGSKFALDRPPERRFFFLF